MNKEKFQKTETALEDGRIVVEVTGDIAEMSLHLRKLIKKLKEKDALSREYMIKTAHTIVGRYRGDLQIVGDSFLYYQIKSGGVYLMTTDKFLFIGYEEELDTIDWINYSELFPV